ncbi:hypothetical protein OLZ33_19360 [Pantoea ananatis]|uniref:hypothetical protein n=1 Tax=Pantoea ananas TaxID=553 RepID=UPI002221E8FA|nr:hypothetical protein [Pantoea ananatis]MCW1834142.1 hypothetical protein [Pantoea ananatis]
MSNIDFEKIERDCSNFNAKSLIAVLPEFDKNKSVRNLVEFQTRHFKNFIIHDNEKGTKRKKRDVFFEDIKKNITNVKACKGIDKVINILHVSEVLIDDIKSNIKASELMKKPIEVQCWSVIENALAEAFYLQELIQNHMAKFKDAQAIFNMSDTNIRDENDNSFSPDSALDKILYYLALTLKMLSYEHNLAIDNEIIIPDRTSVSENEINSAQEIFFLSLIWNDLINCTKSCILFDNDIHKVKTEEIPEEFKNDGLNSAIIFDRTKDSFERYDTISNQRLARRISQNLWEAVSEHSINKKVFLDITQWTGSLNDKPILLEETSTMVFLMEAIATYNPHHLVLDLALSEWLRGYSVLCYISQNAKKRTSYTHGELTSVLRLGGLSLNSAKAFIKHVTFDVHCRDLYDSPLIKTSDSSYLFFTPAYTSPSLGNIILSKFSTKNADLSKKGLRFEKDIIDKLNEHNLINKNFKFKRGSEEYEYDAIFLLDNKAFVLECKNTNLSGGSVTRAYQKKLLFKSTAAQVKRLIYGLKSHPEVFKEHFGKDINNFELIPVIMNNLPFSLPGQFEGVYITDSSSFGRLLASRFLNTAIIQNQNGNITMSNKTPFAAMWEGESLTSTDIINHFNNPRQLTDFEEYTHFKQYPLRTSRERMFFNCLLETDHDAMASAHYAVLTSLMANRDNVVV